MTGGAQIVSTTDATGKGGTIDITAAESLNISGTTPDGWAPSGIFANAHSSGSAGSIGIKAKTIKMDNGTIQASTAGDGDAGNINIEAKTLDITGGGKMRAGTSGKGLGGSIAVSASDSLNIQNGEISASTTSESAGGSIRISSDGNISLSDNAAISSKSTGTGNAGGIAVSAGGNITLNNSTINTDTTNADGGDITIKAQNLLYLYRSAITTSVQGGAGNGGNISIDPTFVVLNGSDIIANAYGGNGGNINIVSDYFLSSPDSKVEASSQLGVSGTVNITAPEVDISGSLMILPSTYLDLTSLLRDRCAAFADEKASSLVVTGQGGMPMEPDDYLVSP
jgi:large exoprotein involved in heme utilization and adhesion